MLDFLFDRPQGLSGDALTVLLGMAVTCLWVMSVRLILRPGTRASAAVAISLFGWTWLGFGVLYVIRFWVLCVDSVTYGNFSQRLAVIPPDVVNHTLYIVLVFWAATCGAFRLTARSGGSGEAPLARGLSLLVGQGTDWLSAVALVAIFLTNSEADIPASVLTPVALVGSVWVVPAAIAWMKWFGCSPGEKRPRVRAWLYLVPGLLFYVWSPFRERLLAVILVPLFSALFAGRRIRFKIVILALLIFGVVGTTATKWQRMVTWGGYTAGEAWAEVEPSNWIRDPYLAPWTQLLQRNHSFDSALLTVELVPSLFPFENRNLILDTVIESLVPRLFLPEKRESARALFFSRTIWSRGDPEGAEVNIAPSIVGDLYSNGGVHWVLIGGVLWGLLIGGLERWRARLPTMSQAVILCYLALLVAGGLERDFSRAIGTIVQGVLVMSAVTFVFTGGALWRRAAESGPEATVQEPESSKWQPSLGAQRGPAQQAYRPPLRERMSPRQPRPGKPFE